MNRTMAVVVVLAVVLLGSCADSPTNLPEDQEFSIGDAGEQLLAMIPVDGGNVAVWSHDLTWDPELEIAEFEVFLVNQSPAPIVAPAALAIRKIDPLNIEFLNPDGHTSEGLLYRFFDEEFGEDGVLEHGESSESLTFRFSVHDARSFAAVFELQPQVGGVITGTVFRDRDGDGVQGGSEPGLAGATVIVFSNGESSLYPGILLRTGPDGEFRVVDLPAGVHTVQLLKPFSDFATTPTSLTVALLKQDDGAVGSYFDADFGVLVAEELVISYDFEDGSIPNWGGNAELVNQDGVLELIATGVNWSWEIFDYLLPGLYTRGVFEFDGMFNEQAYMFGLKGHSEANYSNYAAGPRVFFREGSVLAWINGFVDTGYSYVPGQWYRVRCVFDNNDGERGEYEFYMRELGSDEPEVLIGRFDYDAPGGRLADITEFGFYANTLDQVPTTSFFIDNVYLEVR